MFQTILSILEVKFNHKSSFLSLKTMPSNFQVEVTSNIHL